MGKMAPEGRIAPGNDKGNNPGQFRGCLQVHPDFRSQGTGVLPIKAPGIGQDEKTRPRGQEGLFQGLDGPGGQHRNAMDGLGAGGIVIQNDDFLLRDPDPGLDMRQ